MRRLSVGCCEPATFYLLDECSITEPLGTTSPPLILFQLYWEKFIAWTKNTFKRRNYNTTTHSADALGFFLKSSTLTYPRLILSSKCWTAQKCFNITANWNAEVHCGNATHLCVRTPVRRTQSRSEWKGVDDEEGSGQRDFSIGMNKKGA